MDNLFTVFFIDDEYSDFLNVLSGLGNQKSIRIIPFASVEEGIVAMNESGGCDGIILDLAFPEGKMQGKDGLEIIQKEYPGLPVIILTASYESEDIKTAVECIKIGALHYVGKASLNPDALLEQMSMACKSYLHHRIDSQKLNFKKESKGISESKVYDGDNYKSFAFKLEHVSEPGLSNIASLREEAIAWHKNFFQLISFSYLQNASIELIYKKITGRKLIGVYLIFTVKGHDAEAGENLASLYRDIIPLFSTSKDEKSQVYFFSGLKAEEIKELKTESTQFKTKTAFTQQFAEFHLAKQAGYKSDDHKYGALYIPILKFPRIDEVNSFLQLFSKSIINGELSIEFQPQFLDYEEKKILGLLVRKRTALISENSEKSEQAVENARVIYDNHLSLFKCSMLLRSKDSLQNLHNQLRIGISISFDKDPYDNSNEKPEPYANNLTFNYYTPSFAMASFRLPFPKEGGVPGIKSLNINTVRIPEALVAGGINLGVKKRFGDIVPINIPPKSLRQHLYIMGQTGTGKTTLLKTIINSLIRLKKGFFLIDPHGDLSNEVRTLIESNPSLSSKLIFLDPSDTQCNVKLNFLEYDLKFPEQKSLVINELFKVFEGLYDMNTVGGPVFEQYFNFGMLALLDEETVKKRGFPTFRDFNNFYLNEKFRNFILDIIRDESTKHFFENAGRMNGEMTFANIVPYITSKLNRISDDYYLSRFVNIKESTLNLRDVIDKGKIIIVKLDKGKLGSENVTLFGQLLVNKFNLAAMSRGELPPSERDDFYVIIDEFQNFSRGDIGGSLSELRKFGINMILANQTIWQLKPAIAESVLGNVGNLIFFRPGVKDYELLKYYLEPEFKREDVLKLGNFNCIARLMANNVPLEPFVFQTNPVG